MRYGFTCAIAAAVLVAAPIAAAGQVPASPRTVDGRPNLQGIWQVLNTAAWDIQDHPARLGVPAGQGVVIESSLDLQHWTAVQTNAFGAAPLYFSDPQSAFSGARFYRARLE